MIVLKLIAIGLADIIIGTAIFIGVICLIDWNLYKRANAEATKLPEAPKAD